MRVSFSRFLFKKSKRGGNFCSPKRVTAVRGCLPWGGFHLTFLSVVFSYSSCNLGFTASSFLLSLGENTSSRAGPRMCQALRTHRRKGSLTARRGPTSGSLGGLLWPSRIASYRGKQRLLAALGLPAFVGTLCMQLHLCKQDRSATGGSS